MKFTFSAVLALGTTVRNSDAFLSPAFKLTTTKIHMDQKFVNTLSASPDGNDDNEVNESGDQSGSRFQDMLKLSKLAQESNSPSLQSGLRAIENPFLNSSATTQPSPNSNGLSVEEQARMFREMMAGNQSPSQPPPVTRVAADPGRPSGRNADADKIANTSDLYFAQLKRDSTVRTIGRIQGDDAVSEAIFEDNGIDELENLLLTNPYLKGRKEEEKKLLENVPDQLIAPYFRSDETDEQVIKSSGVSYKQRLLESKQKNLGGRSTPVSPPSQKEEIPEASQVDVPSPQAPPESKPEPVVSQASTTPPLPTPAPVIETPKPVVKVDVPSPQAPPESKPEPVVSQASTTPPLPTPAPVIETPRPVVATSSDDVRRQNLRTLMGLMLKHRGGPGFGKGRLKGPDVDLFEGLVEEITNMLRDEAKLAQPNVDPPVSAAEVQIPAEVIESAPVDSKSEAPVAASASAEPANIDSTIACIEGAITMYNNSPPAIRESVLSTLRAALVAAVDTCNIALASQPAPPVAANPDASIEGMVACIEGAVTMYKNSPPVLKETVLMTLRMALMSAVETCNVILSPGQVSPPKAVVESPPVVQSVTPIDTASSPVSPSPVPIESDRNSEALEKIYEKVQSASGDGKLGLRSDLTAVEASELADSLVDMRNIFMEELDAGIPDPGLPRVQAKPAQDKTVGKKSSTTSRYQEMLAKARAEKAKS